MGASALTGCRLVLMPHWRPEVDDIVDTLREATDPSSGTRLRIVTPGRALVVPRGDRVAGRAVLFSDRGDSRYLKLIPPHAIKGPVFRLWWNGADEIREFLGSPPRSVDPRGETHICFFPDVIAELAEAGLDLLQVPYAFSRPRPQTTFESIPSICYTAEVDISDSCFAPLAATGQAAKLSAATWEMAHEIVGGRLTVVAADRMLVEAGDSTEPLHRAALWAVRNRIRYLLVKALTDAFPGRMVLRGSDWLRLGLPSRRTSRRTTFSRRRRMSDYRRHRVSLDLGSKSTHAMLYPRSADIMAAGGGIVQFDSGGQRPRGLPTLETRQAQGTADLVEVVEHLLSLDESEAAADNARIHQEYCRMRIEVGKSLGDAIASRCR